MIDLENGCSIPGTSQKGGRCQETLKDSFEYCGQKDYEKGKIGSIGEFVNAIVSEHSSLHVGLGATLFDLVSILGAKDAKQTNCQ